MAGNAFAEGPRVRSRPGALGQASIRAQQPYLGNPLHCRWGDQTPEYLPCTCEVSPFGSPELPERLRVVKKK